ncbi:MAG TPA: amidohydrolase family protein [Acidimicrobiia bacterium]|nr:amidohydrolase family protein [Acidimicrobiia bacterium]
MTKTAIISVDGHVKASRNEYRDYLPKQYLEEYDEQVKAAEEAETPDAGNLHPDLAPEQQWDSDLRTGSLERIGVVAEVLFPNGQPFQLNPLDDHPRAANPELAEAGRQAYNRWLVDFCALTPDRRRGQMQTSFLDVDRAVRDIHWAKEHGLGGIMIPEFTPESRAFVDPDLDPIWAACVETGLPLSAHGGASLPGYGPAGFAAMVTVMAENAFFSNRSLWMLVSGGVFDRFPDLRVAYVETQAYLLVAALQHMDSMVNPAGDWMGFARTMDREETTDRYASEYLGRNVFVGVSPFSPVQIPMDELVGKDAEGRPLPSVSIGPDAAMFGVDYPQFESIFERVTGEVANLLTTPGVTDDDVQKILLETAARAYGFDLVALAPHIDRIGFELADVRADASELTRTMQHETKAPIMRSSLARATTSA